MTGTPGAAAAETLYEAQIAVAEGFSQAVLLERALRASDSTVFDGFLWDEVGKPKRETSKVIEDPATGATYDRREQAVFDPVEGVVWVVWRNRRGVSLDPNSYYVRSLDLATGQTVRWHVIDIQNGLRETDSVTVLNLHDPAEAAPLALEPAKTGDPLLDLIRSRRAARDRADQEARRPCLVYERDERVFASDTPAAWFHRAGRIGPEAPLRPVHELVEGCAKLQETMKLIGVLPVRDTVTPAPVGAAA